MKRPLQRRHSIRSSDPFHNFSTEQLSYIGAIALLYNDLEGIIDAMLRAALHVSYAPHELTSRINGMEGKLALIKINARQWGFSESEITHLEDVLGKGGFGLMKTWRDAVIHAQALDAPSGVGRVSERQGRTSEVLLSLEALKGFYHRLDLMRVELTSLRDIISAKQSLTAETRRQLQADMHDQDRERLEQGIERDWVRARERRSQRQSLPPIPEFPEEISALQAFLGLPENLPEHLRSLAAALVLP